MVLPGAVAPRTGALMALMGRCVMLLRTWMGSGWVLGFGRAFLEGGFVVLVLIVVFW